MSTKVSSSHAHYNNREYVFHTCIYTHNAHLRAYIYVNVYVYIHISRSLYIYLPTYLHFFLPQHMWWPPSIRQPRFLPYLLPPGTMEAKRKCKLVGSQNRLAGMVAWGQGIQKNVENAHGSGTISRQTSKLSLFLRTLQDHEGKHERMLCRVDQTGRQNPICQFYGSRQDPTYYGCYGRQDSICQGSSRCPGSGPLRSTFRFA